MPASSARLDVRFLRPWMPAENDPAEPNALTQSPQLTCSLTPSSTVPSTRLVIIWLKRCLARSLTDSVLESEPVGVGVGVGEGDTLNVGVGEGDTLGVGDADTIGDGGGDGGVGLCAEAGMVRAAISSSETAAAETIRLRADPAIVSA